MHGTGTSPFELDNLMGNNINNIDTTEFTHVETLLMRKALIEAANHDANGNALSRHEATLFRDGFEYAQQQRLPMYIDSRHKQQDPQFTRVLRNTAFFNGLKPNELTKLFKILRPIKPQIKKSEGIIVTTKPTPSISPLLKGAFHTIKNIELI